MNKLPLILTVMLCLVVKDAVAQGRGYRGGRSGRGPDASFATDRADFHFLLEHHDDIRRTVSELKNGVQTITESENKEVAAKIQKHVAAMYQRVEKKRPIRMRDPLFAEIFKHADKINMVVTETPRGVQVVETSDNPYVVKLIKEHAKAVSGFAKYGFEEAHKTHALPGKTRSNRGQMRSTGEIANMVFVEFDRQYIPALVVTKLKNPEAATALTRLSKSWDTHFVQHFHERFRNDSKWPRDASQIAQRIALAQAHLGSGTPLRAHEELEAIRDTLMEARQRNNIDYPLDLLSRFHTTMEAIVKPASRLNASSLDQTQMDRFRKLARQADREWAAVETADFDLQAFGKNKTAQKKFPAMLRAERNAIDQLKRALASGDRVPVIEAAQGLKPPFAKVYTFFGDFPKPPPKSD